MPGRLQWMLPSPHWMVGMQSSVRRCLPVPERQEGRSSSQTSPAACRPSSGRTRTCPSVSWVGLTLLVFSAPLGSSQLRSVLTLSPFMSSTTCVTTRQRLVSCGVTTEPERPAWSRACDRSLYEWSKGKRIGILWTCDITKVHRIRRSYRTATMAVAHGTFLHVVAGTLLRGDRHCASLPPGLQPRGLVRSPELQVVNACGGG